MHQNFDFPTTLSFISSGVPDIFEKEISGGNFTVTSQISIQEFFDFLSSAFKSSLDPGDKGYYKELANNQFVTKLLEISVEKFKSNVDSDGKINSEMLSSDRNRILDSKYCLTQDEEKQQGIRSLYIRINKKPNDPDFLFSHLPVLEADNILKTKLQEVINEGILDSMFPFIITKLNAAINAKNQDDFSREGALATHKSIKLATTNKQRIRKLQNHEAEIEIQVCDEVNNISKNFRCSQSLLLSKMEYFADVTEGQRLEDIDISVHCDITIFEYLMKWVHKSSKENCLELNVNNVTPILISAMFLRMEPLVDECVNFFKQNLKEIIDSNSSFSCLSDSILEKIADTMTNTELDALEDSQDKIQSKLFTKFILALSKRKAHKEKGHYSSLATLFRCCYCKQILHDSGLNIPCTSEFLSVDAKGNIQGRHKEDTSWNLNSYIKQLKRELTSWKNVYWKLYGTCHYLDCSKCRMSYPLTHSLCCRYHPNGAHFGVRSNTNNLLIPVGRYMCCGSRTHKFDVLGLPNGCMYRAHVPRENLLSLKLIPILEKKRAAICICPSESLLEGEKDLYNLFGWNSSWWPFSRGNYIDKLHMFNDIIGAVEDKDKESDQDMEYETDIPLKSGLNKENNESSGSEFNDIASVGDGEDSDGSSSSKKYYPQSKSQAGSKLWTTHRSVRFNQDNQRDREERLIKSLVNKLNRNKNEELDFFMSRSDFNSYNISEGGVYALLEEEWREEFNHPELVNTSSGSLKPTKTKSGKYSYF